MTETTLTADTRDTVLHILRGILDVAPENTITRLACADVLGSEDEMLSQVSYDSSVSAPSSDILGPTSTASVSSLQYGNDVLKQRPNNGSRRPSHPAPTSIDQRPASLTSATSSRDNTIPTAIEHKAHDPNQIINSFNNQKTQTYVSSYGSIKQTNASSNTSTKSAAYETSPTPALGLDLQDTRPIVDIKVLVRGERLPSGYVRAGLVYDSDLTSGRTAGPLGGKVTVCYRKRKNNSSNSPVAESNDNGSSSSNRPISGPITAIAVVFEGKEEFVPLGFTQINKSVGGVTADLLASSSSRAFLCVRRGEGPPLTHIGLIPPDRLRLLPSGFASVARSPLGFGVVLNSTKGSKYASVLCTRIDTSEIEGLCGVRMGSSFGVGQGGTPLQTPPTPGPHASQAMAEPHRAQHAHEQNTDNPTHNEGLKNIPMPDMILSSHHGSVNDLQYVNGSLAHDSADSDFRVLRAETFDDSTNNQNSGGAIRRCTTPLLDLGNTDNKEDNTKSVDESEAGANSVVSRDNIRGRTVSNSTPHRSKSSTATTSAGLAAQEEANRPGTSQTSPSHQLGLVMPSTETQELSDIPAPITTASPVVSGFGDRAMSPQVAALLVHPWALRAVYPVLLACVSGHPTTAVEGLHGLALLVSSGFITAAQVYPVDPVVSGQMTLLDFVAKVASNCVEQGLDMYMLPALQVLHAVVEHSHQSGLHPVALHYVCSALWQAKCFLQLMPAKFITDDSDSNSGKTGLGIHGTGRLKPRAASSHISHIQTEAHKLNHMSSTSTTNATTSPTSVTSLPATQSPSTPTGTYYTSAATAARTVGNTLPTGAVSGRSNGGMSASGSVASLPASLSWRGDIIASNVNSSSLPIVSGRATTVMVTQSQVREVDATITDVFTLLIARGVDEWTVADPLFCGHVEGNNNDNSFNRSDTKDVDVSVERSGEKSVRTAAVGGELLATSPSSASTSSSCSSNSSSSSSDQQILLSEQLSVDQPISLSEQLLTDQPIPFSEQLSADQPAPLSEQLSDQSIPLSEKPSTDQPVPLSEQLLTDQPAQSTADQSTQSLLEQPAQVSSDEAAQSLSHQPLSDQQAQLLSHASPQELPKPLGLQYSQPLPGLLYSDVVQSTAQAESATNKQPNETDSIVASLTENYNNNSNNNSNNNNNNIINSNNNNTTTNSNNNNNTEALPTPIPTPQPSPSPSQTIHEFILEDIVHNTLLQRVDSLRSIMEATETSTVVQARYQRPCVQLTLEMHKVCRVTYPNLRQQNIGVLLLWLAKASAASLSTHQNSNGSISNSENFVAIQLQSKLCGLRLLREFLKLAAAGAQDVMVEGGAKSLVQGLAMGYQIRRFVCTAILPHCKTRATPLFQELLAVITELWKHYRRHLKTEMAVIMETVLLRVLKSPYSNVGRKIDVLDSVVSWYDIQPVYLVEIFLNFQNDPPVKHWKVMEDMVETMCALGEGYGTGGGGSISSRKGSGTLGSLAGSAGGDGGGSCDGMQVSGEVQLQLDALRALVTLMRILMDASASVYFMATDNRVRERSVVHEGEYGWEGAHPDDENSMSIGSNGGGAKSDVTPESSTNLNVTEENLDKHKMEATSHGVNGDVVPGNEMSDVERTAVDEGSAVQETTAGLQPLPAVSRQGSTHHAHQDAGGQLVYEPASPTRRSSVRQRHELQQRSTDTLTKAVRMVREEGKGLRKAVAYLMATNYIEETPLHVASLLRVNLHEFGENAIGEYLGQQGNSEPEKMFMAQVRLAFVSQMRFAGRGFLESLRTFLTNGGFRLPGEAQQIERLLEAFAHCYYHDNQGLGFRSSDAVLVLAFSVVMLNTDLHNAQVKRKGKMTKEQFIRNLGGSDLGGDLPRPMLEGIYDSVVKREIKMIISGQGGATGGDLAAGDANGAVGGAGMGGPVHGGDPAVGRSHSAGSLYMTGGQHPSHHHDSPVAMLENMFEMEMADAVRQSIAILSGDSMTCRIHHSKVNADSIRVMFEVVWLHYFTIISAILENPKNMSLDMVSHALDMLRYAISASLFLGMETERCAFAKLLAKLNFLNSDQPASSSSSGGSRGTTSVGGAVGILTGKHLEQEWFANVMQASNTSGDITNVVAEVHHLAIDMKERVTQRQSYEQLVAIEKRFDSSLKIVDYSREFYREGQLVKRCRRQDRRYNFLLFSDTLVYASCRFKSKWHVHQNLPLRTMRIVDLPDRLFIKNAFEIRSPVKTFVVMAANRKQKVEWLRDITHAIDAISRQNLETRRLSLLSSSNNTNAAAAAVAASATTVASVSGSFDANNKGAEVTTASETSLNEAVDDGLVSSNRVQTSVSSSTSDVGTDTSRGIGIRVFSFSRSPSTSPSSTAQPSPSGDSHGDSEMANLPLPPPPPPSSISQGSSPLLANALAVSVDADGLVIDSDSDNDNDQTEEEEEEEEDDDDDDDNEQVRSAHRQDSVAQATNGVSDVDLQAMFLRGVMFGKPILASEDDAIEATDEDKLLMYGYFKQSTQGDCNQPEPEGQEGSVEHEKWVAWSNTRALSAREAMLEFMAVLDRLAPGWLGFT